MALLVKLAAGAACLLSALAIGVAQASDTVEESEYGVLFVADGVDDTYYTCIGCHSERIIAQQGLSRENWDEMLVWMVEEQGMPELDEETRDVILDYLAQHYNVDRPNFPQN